jgi:hypothetical protein
MQAACGLPYQRPATEGLGDVARAQRRGVGDASPRLGTAQGSRRLLKRRETVSRSGRPSPEVTKG